MTRTGTYLDALDDHNPPVVKGVPSSPKKTSSAFHRKAWGIRYIPGTPEFAAHERAWSWPPPPSIPCRDATAEETLGPARAVAETARHNGWTVRVTFAQGPPRGVGANRGKCSCGSEVRLYKESGKMFPHKVPTPEGKTACPGDAPAGASCGACGQKVKLGKKGKSRKHYILTEECKNDGFPKEVIPGEEIPGNVSVAVRIPGLGVSVWEGGQFKGAWVRCTMVEGKLRPDTNGLTWGPVPIGTFREVCRSVRQG